MSFDGGGQIRELRQRRGLTQERFAEILNAALGRRYGSSTIGRWENGKANVPEAVQSFVDQLSLEEVLPPYEGSAEGEGPEPVTVGDSAPGGGGGRETPAAQTPITGQSGLYTRACVELWELVATGVGMTGAALGSEALMVDGAIIDADKQALGQAWGKLAEQNDTFRRMLVGLTEGGAWLQVAIVTGSTVSKCYANHAQLALAAIAARNGSFDGAEPAAAA